jgi:hypothetical protein
MMKRLIVVLSIPASARQPGARDFKLTTFFDKTAFLSGRAGGGLARREEQRRRHNDH